ncbi:nuclear transport factor 2 family protein [Nocardioides sp. GY 10127]|uniref:nuclear transport factor 2 family protein n=1 Tax=Nocardioides sp. GY 10127 TaxID=2569762 RepID=UPI0010A7BBD9|nr:nuclear transport factor 2 family protein [Nocardioides sp. GY 10127]TIC79300.1 nuclear transport factor 2 family protein [Nocardioides sp. GY 10127]
MPTPTSTSPGPVVVADEAVRAEVLAVEAARRKALLEVDLETLDDLYDESLVHVHAPGLTHDKAQLMEHVATRQAYLDMTRGPLLVRLVGDVAIVTGRIVNRLSSPDGTERIVAGPAIQVLRRCEDGRWRFLSFQMTPDGEHIWPPTESELASMAAERGDEPDSTPTDSSTDTTEDAS